MEPFALFDPTTGEVPTPTELLKNLAELDDDQVLDLLDRAGRLQQDLSYAIGILKSHAIHRMEQVDATVYDSPMFEAKLERKVTYRYDVPLLMQLQAHLPKDKFEKAVQMEPKVSKTELNKLVKLGGPVKTIIDQAVTPVPGPPSLTYQRKLA